MAKSTQQANQAKGCGCLLLVVLVPVSMLYSCIKGPDEPATLSAAPSSIVAAPPTTVQQLAQTPSAASSTTTTSRATTTTTTPRGTPRPNPQPDPDPDPNRELSTRRTTSSGSSSGSSVYYANCDAVRAAGAAPIRRGDPGYSPKLDRDGDGVGCAGD